MDHVKILIYIGTRNALIDYLKEKLTRVDGKPIIFLFSDQEPSIAPQISLPACVKIYAWHIASEALDCIVCLAIDYLTGDVIGYVFPCVASFDKHASKWLIESIDKLFSNSETSNLLMQSIICTHNQDELNKLYVVSKDSMSQRNQKLLECLMLLNKASLYYPILRSIIVGSYKAHRAISMANNNSFFSQAGHTHATPITSLTG